MQFFDNIILHYGWQGIALLGAFFTLFAVQFYYYAIAYNRIYNFRLVRTLKKRCSDPGISVIIALRGENEYFLSHELPTILSQEYDYYEVVVVYIGGDADFYGELQRMRETYPHLRLTKMGGNERIYITTKQALNVGIKSAQYDNFLFTMPGSLPRSEQWVKVMSRGFERGMVVVGPSVPAIEEAGFRPTLMRLTELHRSRNAFAQAVSGKFYWAPRSNFGFTRKLYNSTRGFDHLNLDLGENDLYMQAIANPRRTAVVLSPHAVTVEERPSEWRDWLEVTRYNDTTLAYYPTRYKTFRNWERYSRLLFFLVALVALVVLPTELKIGVMVTTIVRYLIVVWSSRRTAHKLGENNIAWRYWIYDLIGPVVDLIIERRPSRETASAWR
ncbi:MAG: glycosyltransferase [Alistipes sp.]|nr:glycosyltransferase [Alistipes sp.]